MPNKIVGHNYKAKVAKSKLEAAKMKIRRRDKVYRYPYQLNASFELCMILFLQDLKGQVKKGWRKHQEPTIPRCKIKQTWP